MHKNLGDCPYSQQCSPSAYGRVVYTKPKDDFRLFTQTPRGSKAWKKMYARRTTVERSIKRTLVDYLLESRKHRTKKIWFWFVSLAAINQHLDAQVKTQEHTLFARLGLEAKAA